MGIWRVVGRGVFDVAVLGSIESCRVEGIIVIRVGRVRSKYWKSMI